MNEQKSKVIVITGASSGIGEVTARRLAKAGHAVVLGARRADRLTKIVEEITHEGGTACCRVVDVTKKADVEQLAQFAMEKTGRIDVWMNNAGLMPQSRFDQLKVAEWDQMLDVNLKGVLYGIAAALPIMRKQNQGQFINIASVAGHTIHSGSGVYSATKFGVRVISEALRQEEVAAKSNIRVTVISPGAVATELPNTITDPVVKERVDRLYREVAIPAERVAESIEFAIDMAGDTTLDEIVLRPTEQP